MTNTPVPVDTAVPPQPEVKKEDPKPTDSFIDKRRQEVEKQLTAPDPVKPEEVPAPPEPQKEDPKSDDPIARIKQSVQKRIDKVVAQKKSAEEELAEARAEIDRLKQGKAPEVPAPKDDTPPTPEQVEAYIVKMREEGNTKEEIAATRYLIKLEKELALKEVRDSQDKAQKEADASKKKQLVDWTNLCRDYEVYGADGKPDTSADMSLANQNGLLYKTALSLYNDKDLHKDFYDDPNVLNGFRRAVADAYREIHQQGLLKQPPKEEPVIPRNPREQLADPSATSSDDTPVRTEPLSNTDKVREEIIARRKNRLIRPLR